jgi:hypothetical protein
LLDDAIGSGPRHCGAPQDRGGKTPAEERAGARDFVCPTDPEGRMTGRVQSIGSAREISPHGVGVKLEGAQRPSTWDEWHAAEVAAWQLRYQVACELAAAAQNEGRGQTANRDRWRLAAVFGWGLVILLVLARMQG